MLDPDALRLRFPALQMTVDGHPAVFLDGPGGTQVPQSVIDAVSGYYREMNANSGGAFLTSRRSDEMVEDARIALADFLNARAPSEILFSQNMTTHTFNLSRAIGSQLGDGDDVVCTWLDHEANVSPWEALQERGVTVHRVEVRPEDCTLDMEDLAALINERTRVVAVGYASNAVGTINDVRRVVDLAHLAGALAYVDAVHYAPHGPIDVQALDCDFLACSAYKFFGPHLGVLYGKQEVLDGLPAYKVRPSHDRFETGTPNFEGIAGAKAAVEYLASVGRQFGEPYRDRWPGFVGQRLELKAAMSAAQEYERGLFERLAAGLAAIPGVRLYGISDRGRFDRRAPTAGFILEGVHPDDVARGLARRGIFVWSGDFYAQGLVEKLGLSGSGGLVRAGLAHYNTAAEVDRFLAAVADMASQPRRG